jgi:hypothetical protein
MAERSSKSRPCRDAAKKLAEWLLFVNLPDTASPVKTNFRIVPVLLCMTAVPLSRATTIIYPTEAIADIWNLTADEFHAKYAGINTSGLGPSDEGWYVRYRHENLTYLFGPLAEREDARRAQWEIEAVRDAAIRNRPSLVSSQVDFVRFRFSGVYGKRGDGSGGAGGESDIGGNDDDKNGAGGSGNLSKDGSGEGGAGDGAGKDGKGGKGGLGEGDKDGASGAKLAGSDGEGGDGTGAGGKDGKSGRKGGKGGSSLGAGDGSGDDGSGGAGGQQGPQVASNQRGGRGGQPGGQGGQSAQSGQSGQTSGQQGGSAGGQAGASGGQPGGSSGPSSGSSGGGGNPLSLVRALLRMILGL